MTNENTTLRDDAWLAVIDALQRNHPVSMSDIADCSDVSTDTARRVLRVAEGAGLLTRTSSQSPVWRPSVFIADVDDPEYQRAIKTLVDEAGDGR